MIFKADDLTVQLVAGEHVVADHAVFGADGVEVERAGEVALRTVPRLIILPQHLIAAADGQHRQTVLDG